MSTVRERALGAVIGSAVGDAVGAPYEFGAPNPQAPCDMEGGGVFGWQPGEWTDDTQLALTVLSALPDPDPVQRAAFGMLRWLLSGPVDVGAQTRVVLAGCRQARDLPQVAAAYQELHPQAAGNGALMRTGPVALVGPDPARIAHTAAEIAALTHPHPDSTSACVLWSVAIGAAVFDSVTPTSEDEWRVLLSTGLPLLPVDQRSVWADRIAEPVAAETLSASNGWVVDAFRAAVACLLGGPDGFRLGICRAARSGGDTDTVAAIAGSLLGAVHGVGSIPPRWLQVLHGRRCYDEDPFDLAAVTGLVDAVLG